MNRSNKDTYHLDKGCLNILTFTHSCM